MYTFNPLRCFAHIANTPAGGLIWSKGVEQVGKLEGRVPPATIQKIENSAATILCTLSI